jgi:hypothetical protein
MSDLAANRLVLPRKLVLPLEFHLNLPFLRGELDGRPAMLLLDSGAPGITLNAAHLPEEKLQKGGELMGASGTVPSFRAELQELKLGEWRMGPMSVLALNETQLEEAFGVRYDGLIGFRELIYFDWMVDYDAAEFHLWSNFKKNDYEVAHAVRVRYLNHLPVINMTMAGKEYQMLLDTGASGIVFDQEKKDELAAVLEEVQEDELQGAGGKKLIVSGGRLTSFEVSGFVVEDSEIKFTDISALQNRLGSFDGIIGYSLLSKARVVVSWEQRHIYILRGPEGKGDQES